jgi:hypothetical protein
MMKGSFRWTGVAILVVALLVAGTARAAEKDAPLSAETELRRVALFKNGMGFFVHDVALPDGQSREFALEAPLAPAHGTFWVTHPDDAALDEVVASPVTRPVEQQARDIRGLLRGNVGKRLIVHLSPPGGAPIEGKLIYAPEGFTAAPSDPYAAGSNRRPTPGTTTGLPHLFVLGTDTGAVALAPNDVRRVEFPDDEATLTYEQEEEGVRLRGRLAQPAPGRELTVSYLAKGMTWAPSYTVDVSDPDEATISAKALIFNEAADLDDIEVSLVTGFPHMLFADVTSPIAMKERLSRFLRNLREGGQESQRPRGHGVVTQQMTAYRPADFDPAAFLAREAVGEAEDLFLYPLHDVTLARGEVGYYPLFTASIPYQHVHQWDVPDMLDERDRYRPGRTDEEEKPEVVWHSLRLTNETDVPWTTAPGQTVSRNQILGQDILHYTPVGGQTTLRITQAVGVKAEQVEYEVERERNAASFHGTSYDLVTLSGELRVTNFKKDAVTLEITKMFSGELISADGDPELRDLARGLRRVNPRGRLRWTIDLEPGRQEELTYIYEVYLR